MAHLRVFPPLSTVLASLAQQCALPRQALFPCRPTRPLAASKASLPHTRHSRHLLWRHQTQESLECPSTHRTRLARPKPRKLRLGSPPCATIRSHLPSADSRRHYHRPHIDRLRSWLLYQRTSAPTDPIRRLSAANCSFQACY